MKGMHKIKLGKDFKGVCFYVEFGKGNIPGHGRWIGGSAAANDAAALAHEFSAIANLRLDIEKPVWHNSLRMPKGEDVTDEKWVQIAETYLEKMGFDLGKTQYKFGKHDDDEHIHNIANRVMTDGTVYWGQNENLRSTRVIEELERIFGLSITPGVDSTPRSGKSRPTRNEQEKAIRTREKPVRMILQEVVATAMQGQPNTSIFLERLDAAGIETIPNIGPTGLMNGFSFILDGLAFSGSKLGADYKWVEILKRVDYEQDRDGEELRRRRDAARIGATNDGATEAAPGAAEIVGRVDRADFTNSGIVCSTIDGIDGKDVTTRNVIDGAIPADRAISGSDHANSSSVAGHDAITESDGRALEDDRVGSTKGQGKEIVDTVAPINNELPKKTDRVIDIAAAKRIVEEIVGPVERKELAAQISAWRCQHDALQAMSYRITLKDSVVSDRDRSLNIVKAMDQYDTETFYDADSVESMIPELRMKNARGFDVYLTPIDERFHYIVVDDLKSGAVAEMKAEGYTPALVQLSSEDNQQAIIKVPRENRKDEQHIANKLVLGLNNKYGSEKVPGVIHPFRMAGFSNKKPDKKNSFTIIIESAGGICSKALDILSSLRESLDIATAAQVMQINKRKRVETIENVGSHAEAGPTREYHQRAAFIIKNGKQPVDWAIVDFGVACEMYKRNFKTESIAIALREGSPGVVEHHENIQGYIEKTLEAARQSMRVDREYNSNPPPTSGSPAPP